MTPEIQCKVERFHFARSLVYWSVTRDVPDKEYKRQQKEETILGLISNILLFYINKLTTLVYFREHTYFRKAYFQYLCIKIRFNIFLEQIMLL